MPTYSEQFPWLQGLEDWYDESPIPGALDAVGDYATEAVLPLLAQQAQPFYKRFPAQLDAAQAMSRNALEAMVHGTGALAAMPYAEKLYPGKGVDMAITNMREKLSDPALPYTQGGQDVFNTIGALAAPEEAASEALGERGYQLAGPVGGAVGETIIPAAGMLFGLNRAPRQLSTRDLGFGEPVPQTHRLGTPRGGVTGRGGPGRRQEGAVRVVDPDATTIQEMFEKTPRPVSPLVTSKPEGALQAELFPTPTPFKSALPEAVARIEEATGGKYIKPKRLREELNRAGVKPAELKAFGVEGFLQQAEAEGWDVLPSDITDQMNENELQIVRGGSVVPYDEDIAPADVSEDRKRAEQYVTDLGNKTRRIMFENSENMTDDLTAALMEVAPDLSERQASTTARTAIRAMQSDLQKFVQHAAGQLPWPMSEIRSALPAFFDKVAKSANVVDPALVSALSKYKDKIIDTMDQQIHWRREAKRIADREPDFVDPRLRGAQASNIGSVSERLGTAYIDDYKWPGALENVTSVYSMPESAFGGRNVESARHFPSPRGYAGMGHLRGSRRLLTDDVDFDDLTAGQMIETSAHIDERQFDAHRTAQSHPEQYGYGRDLYPTEQSRYNELVDEEKRLSDLYDGRQYQREDTMAQYDRRMERGEDVQSEYDDWRYQDNAASDALIKQLEDVREEKGALKKIKAGPMPDLPYKERVEQTVLTLKDMMLQAAQRGDEWVTIAGRRQTGMNQGSQEMPYVEDAYWNGENWVTKGFYGNETEIPYVEIEPHLPEKYKGKDGPGDFMDREDFMKNELMLQAEDPDWAKDLYSQIENVDIIYDHIHKVPDKYMANPAVKREMQDVGLDEWLWDGWREEDAAERIAAITGDSVDDVLRDINATETYSVWDTDSHRADGKPLATDEEYTYVDDFFMEAAKESIENISPRHYEDYIGDPDYLWEDYLENSAPSVNVGENLILEEGAAGAAANYADEISIPAIKRIHREYGEEPYTPKYRAIGITDDVRYMDEHDYDTTDQVLGFRMTPKLIKGILNDNYMFAPLNPKPRTKAERRAESYERRAKNPESLLFTGGQKEILEKRGGKLYPE